MPIKTASWRIIVLALLAAFGLLVTPADSADSESKEALSMVRRIDFDECEPVKIQGKIMEVRPDTGAIVVVEREIRAMNVENGDRRIKTSYLNREGNPVAQEAFRAGQYVLVEGFLHPDGFIAAFLVQEIEKPVEKKTKYKPVESSKKESRKTRTAAQGR